MNILYFNNCWFSNVGEAFIDIGSHVILKQVFGEETIIANASDMTFWYIQNNNHFKSGIPKNGKRIFPNRFRRKFLDRGQDLFRLYKADYFVLSGMFACDEFLKSPAAKSIVEITDRGIKIIFLGLGGLHYDKKEVENFTNYLDRINPYLITTRDLPTFENYGKRFPCIRGIDCAFWVKDVFEPKGMADFEYDIVSFNRSREPKIYKMPSWPYPIIRPNHFQYDFNLQKVTEHIMVSDSPYDYLTLYANAHNVYTDLVHATIASLQYSVPVKFFPVDGRAQLFKSLDGMEEVDGFWMLDQGKLENKKMEIIETIKGKI